MAPRGPKSALFLPPLAGILAALVAVAMAREGSVSRGRFLAESSKLIEALNSKGNYGTLVTAIKAIAGHENIDAILSGGVTLLAPNDDAFSQLDPAVLKLIQSNAQVRKGIMAQHLLKGFYTFDVLEKLPMETPLNPAIDIPGFKLAKLANDTAVQIGTQGATNGVGINVPDLYLSIDGVSLAVQGVDQVIMADNTWLTSE